MKSFAAPHFAAVLIAVATVAAAESVMVSIEQETQLGQSVFVSAPHPLFGDGTVERSVKLSPHAYPTWQVSFDLPPGVMLTPTFLLRNDSPSQVPSSTNVIATQEGKPISTSPPASTIGQRFVIWTSPDVESVTARVFAAHLEFTPIEFDFTASDEFEDDSRFMGEVATEHVAMGRRLEIRVDGNTITPSGGLRLHGYDLEYRHGQFFRGAARILPPATTRRETFTWTPTDTRFKPRTIRIQLPRDYDNDMYRTWPVLYAQDGQNVFAPGGPFGSWDLDVITRNFATFGEIPDIILIGIDNTSDRNLEYIPSWLSLGDTSGRGEDYLALIRDELMPEIATRYRVASGPVNTAHMGSSLGGVLGFVATHEFSDTFGAVVAMSPSTWIDRAAFIARATAMEPDERARLWIDSGTAGTSNDAYVDTIALRDAMIAAGHAIGPGFAHAVGLNHQHNEAAWRLRSPDALRWLFNAVSPEVSEHTDVFIVNGPVE